MKCSQDGQIREEPEEIREEPENPITSEEDSGFEFSEIIEEIAVSELTLGERKP